MLVGGSVMLRRNKRLEHLLKIILISDQKNRMKKSEMDTLEAEDQLRYALAKVVLSGRMVYDLNACSLYALAMILHHTGKATDLIKAWMLAGEAASKGYPKARWLWAAVFDRRKILLGKPQRYGTQFKFDTKTGRVRLRSTDGLCTDAERIRLGLPTLSEITESLEPTPYHRENHPIG